MWSLLWGLTFGLGMLAAWVAVSGIRRDTRAGEPVIALPLDQATDWREAHFRVLQDGHWRLRLSAVAFDSSRVDLPLEAAFQVQVRAPGGRVVLDRAWSPGETGILLPWNYGDALLDSLTLDGGSLRRWTLAVRVTSPDPRFAGVTTELKLWQDRYDPGMGGLVSYVLILPAGLLLLVSALAATPLLRAPVARRAPLLLSLTSLFFFLGFLFTSLR